MSWKRLANVMLLVTGPVSINMQDALKRTYDAMPDPKFVIAVGDCAVCGGIFGKTYATRGSIANVIPVHHTLPGCPPTPVAILAGILDAVLPVQRQGAVRNEAESL